MPTQLERIAKIEERLDGHDALLSRIDDNVQQTKALLTLSRGAAAGAVAVLGMLAGFVAFFWNGFLAFVTEIFHLRPH